MSTPETCTANVGVPDPATSRTIRMYCSLPGDHLGNHVTIDLLTGKPYEFDR